MPTHENNRHSSRVSTAFHIQPASHLTVAADAVIAFATEIPFPRMALHSGKIKGRKLQWETAIRHPLPHSSPLLRILRSDVLSCFLEMPKLQSTHGHVILQYNPSMAMSRILGDQTCAWS